jgi:hypothetical protein
MKYTTLKLDGCQFDGIEKPVVVVWPDMEATEFSTKEAADIEIERKFFESKCSPYFLPPRTRIYVFENCDWKEKKGPNLTDFPRT